MKIAIYNPYLDSAGGGEKYMLTIAEFLSKKEDVDILVGAHLKNKDIKAIIKKIEQMHNLNLSKVNVINAPLGPGSNFKKRLGFLKKYDYLFYNSDGSIFLSTAQKSIVHFQLPFINAGNGFWERTKYKSWTSAIYNSNFTKKYIEKSLSLSGEVIYPPVDVSNFKPLKKKKQILSVGRFTNFKKHQLMVDVFKQLVTYSDIKNTTLHLAGGSATGDAVDLDKLRIQIKGFPITLHQDINLEELIKLYGESLIYWHAAGFGETNPKNMEHFGITTVEAMVSGCIPVVIGLGGQPEIVEDGQSGFLWNSIKEWKEKTVKVLNDKKLQQNMSKKGIEKSKLFSKERFCKQIQNLVYGDN